MGAVPGCTRAGLPMVARRGSEVRGKLDKGDKPRKGEAQRCAGVREGEQGCAKVCRGVQRCTEGCARWCASHEGARLAKSGSTWVAGSWKMGKWVWWAHRRYSNHRINDATRAGLWRKILQAMGNKDERAHPNVGEGRGSEQGRGRRNSGDNG